MPKLEVLDEPSLRKTLESLLFITDKPLSLDRLCQATGIKESTRVSEVLTQIQSEWDSQELPWQLMEVADGFQMSTRASYAPFIRKIFAERMTMRLSRAAHETLAIVAYRQPITRAEIETVRGVDVIAALENLLEKGLVRVVGRRETVGRPLMYGTTVDFLRHFGLKSLEEMPPLDQFTPTAPQETTAAPSENIADEAASAQLPSVSNEISQESISVAPIFDAVPTEEAADAPPQDSSLILEPNPSPEPTEPQN